MPPHDPTALPAGLPAPPVAAAARPGPSSPAARPRAVARTVGARAPLRLATGAANAEILTGLREAVRNQVGSYVLASREGPFTASQAGALHRLAQTYQLLAGATAAEQGRYDTAGLSEAELAAALAQLGSGEGAGTE